MDSRLSREGEGRRKMWDRLRDKLVPIPTGNGGPRIQVGFPVTAPETKKIRHRARLPRPRASPQGDLCSAGEDSRVQHRGQHHQGDGLVLQVKTAEGIIVNSKKIEGMKIRPVCSAGEDCLTKSAPRCKPS